MLKALPRLLLRYHKSLLGIAAIVILGVVMLGLVQADSIYIVDTNSEIVVSSDILLVGGNPAMLYWAYDTQQLKLAQCSNPACETGTTTFTTLDSGANIGSVGMTLVNGNPLIAYSDGTLSGPTNLKVIACPNQACDPVPTPRVIYTARYIDRMKVLTVNDLPVIIFVEWASSILVTPQILACSDATCSETQDIQSPLVLLNQSNFGSIDALEVNSNLVIAYVYNNQLVIRTCNGALCATPTATVLDTQPVSNAVSISMAVLNDKAVVAYPVQTINTPLKLVFCSSSLCNGVPTYATPGIQNPDYGFSLQNIGGTLKIAYVKSDSLRLATCANSTCSSVTQKIISNADTTKRYTDLIDVGGTAGLSYLSGNGTLRFYYDGTYVPAMSATPSQTGLPVTPTPGPTLTPSPTPSLTTPTNTRTPSSTPTRTPLPTVTPTRTPLPTNTPVTFTPTPSLTRTPTSIPAPTNTPKPTNTKTPTLTPTSTPTNTLMPTSTPIPSVTPTNTPFPTETPIPTLTPSPLPTQTPDPTLTPSSTPTITPLPTETAAPTQTPTPIPSITPTFSIGLLPTSAPDAAPKHRLFTTGYPTLSWSNVSWAYSYDVEISASDSFSGVIEQHYGIPADALAFTPQTPMSSGLYFYRVRAVRADGTPGAWSAAELFIILVV